MLLTLIIYGTVIAGGFTLLLSIPRILDRKEGARAAIGSPGGGGSQKPPALIMFRTHDGGASK